MATESSTVPEPASQRCCRPTRREDYVRGKRHNNLQNLVTDICGAGQKRPGPWGARANSCYWRAATFFALAGPLQFQRKPLHAPFDAHRNAASGLASANS